MGVKIVKLGIKSLILAVVIISVLGVQAFAITLDGDSTGKASANCYCGQISGVTHEIGVSRSEGIFKTYAYSWVGANGSQLFTVTYIGTATKKATGYGWAQTPTFSAGTTSSTVTESHGIT